MGGVLGVHRRRSLILEYRELVDLRSEERLWGRSCDIR
jgi:hypothetical protein